MKIVHAADLHIDSPLRGLSRYPNAPVDVIRNATRRAFENLIDLCLQERVALLLLAGDVFDGNWRDYSTGMFFAAQLARLRQGGVRVVTVRGNHDAKSQITRELRLPENVTELSTRKPETKVFEDLGIAVHGQGFAAREVPEDLVVRYPAPLEGLFNVGLLHTSLDGRPGHDPYAPTSLQVLCNRGYDYWALGHVHAREVLCEAPHVVFPGNLQARHMRETGPKGATLLTLERGRLRDVRHEILDAVRFASCEVDLSAAADGHDAVELARSALAREVAQAGGRLLAARVVFTGRSRAHARLAADLEHWTEQVRAASLDADGAVWLENVQLRTRSELDVQALAARGDALGQLTAGLLALEDEPAALEEWCAALAYELKLPREALLGDDGLRLADPAFIAELLPEVRELLLSRLLDAEGA